MLRTRVLTGENLFFELEGDWKALVDASSTATPFQSYEWISTWWKHHGSLKKPLVLAFFEGEDLVGLYPLYTTLGVWRTLRPMGVGASDYLHPLAQRGYEQAVNHAVCDYLQSADCDLIDLHQIREDRAWFGSIPSGSHEAQATCLVLDLPSTYDQYLATLGKSLRYDVKKLDKMVFKGGTAKVEPVQPGDTQRGFDYLFELHKERWRKRKLPGAFLGGAMKFHREWAELAQARGWLWLSILRLNEMPVGAIYAMKLGSTAYYYQAGFSPESGSISPGTLLVATTIRRSIEEGVSKFDFLRGDEGYKRRWKPQHKYKNYRTISAGAGALGRLGSKWNSMGFRVETRIRARLEGRGLV